MDTVFAWLLTYWLHSTIALGGMWAASRFLRERNLALEEAGWKVALFATLFTATIQVGLTRTGEFRPLAGALELQVARSTPEAADRAFDTASEPATEAAAGAAVALPSRAAERVALASKGATASLFETHSMSPVAAAFGLWMLTTTILMIRLVVSYLTLMGRLKDRRVLLRGTHFALLERLRSRAGVLRRVGLSVCASLPVPLALGLRRWEVCLPSRVTEEFDADEQETVLAHELAHLVRYDTLWLLAARTLAGALFVQPLNFLVAGRLRALSELRCDDWAVERTGRPVTLAKCLTRVASWRSDHWSGLPVPAMAGSSPSQFGARVRRLLARSYPQPQGRVPRWLKLAVAPMVIVFAAAAPGVVERSEAKAPSAASSLAPEAPEAPEVLPDRLANPEPPAPEAPRPPIAPRPRLSPLAPTVSAEAAVAAETVSPSPAPASPVPPVSEAVPVRRAEVPLAPEASLASPASMAPLAPLAPIPPLVQPARKAPPVPRDDLDKPVPLGPTAVGVEAPAPPAAPLRAVPLASARFARLNASGSFVGSDSAPMPTMTSWMRSKTRSMPSWRKWRRRSRMSWRRWKTNSRLRSKPSRTAPKSTL